MKRLTSFLLALAISASSVFVVSAEESAAAEDLVICQVYGGGGKGETPISNSFIELHNPTGITIGLSGYSLEYGEKRLELTGELSADSSYLIVGAAEETTDEFITYDLPEADLDCDWVISNKNYTITLTKGETEIDSITAGNSAETKVSKQKSLKKNAEGNYSIILWEKGEVVVDEAYITENAPRNSKGEYGNVHGESEEPSYTPVVTGNDRVKGFLNDTNALSMELAGRYNSGAMNADGGSLEIVTYNPSNGFAYAVSGVKGKLMAVNLNGSLDGAEAVSLTGTEYDVKKLIDGFAYGDMTSVAVSPDGSKLAAAIQAENYSDNGAVALFSCKADGSLELISTAVVGVQPDMVTFADNGTILTANEGEPRNGVNGADPKGSVSIVTIDGNNALSAKTVYFDSFDSKRDLLTGAGVLVQKDKLPSEDFEPEYIAVSGNTAYVSLQEANSIAVLDIPSAEFTGIYPLGFCDYGTTKVDLQKNDTIELKNYENVYGIRMPDGISAANIDGETYILTANEGDSRADWSGMDNESEGTTSPTGGVTLDKKVVWFNASMWDGLDQSKAYVFGGRSFSIYEATEDGLNLVFDSGSDFEEITADKLPAYFNTSNDKTSVDNRSGKKGPEPETVVTGKMGGRTLAFIALERIGGVVVYDITNPENAQLLNYINSREFDDVIKGDVSPEGLFFVSASDSKNGNDMLLAACEVSGTMAVYQLEHVHIADEDYSSDETGHWKTCSGCDEKLEFVEHTFDSGVVTTEPTENEEGEKTYTCTVCGYTKTEPVEKLEHTHNPNESYSFDKTGHWKTCSGCDEKLDFGEHISDEGTVTAEPTAFAEGTKTYRCTVCGYVIKTETIPAKGSTINPWLLEELFSDFSEKLDAECELNGSKVALKWNKIDNAEKYVVYQYKNGEYVKLITTEKTKITISNLKNGKSYKFLVRYVVDGKLSPKDKSAVEKLTAYYKPIPTAVSGENSAKLSWKAVEGAEKYAVYRYVNGKAVKLAETEKLAVNIRKLKSDKEYMFIIRAYVNGQWTDMKTSDIVEVKTK